MYVWCARSTETDVHHETQLWNDLKNELQAKRPSPTVLRVLWAHTEVFYNTADNTIETYTHWNSRIIVRIIKEKRNLPVNKIEFLILCIYTE